MEQVALLASGGLDSSVLLADLAREHQVFPLYVRQGLAWESAEQRMLRAYVRALHNRRVRRVTVLKVPMRSVYGGHWSVTGEGVPGPETPDTAVYLPGRNVLLIGLAAVWCSVRGVSRIAIASLGGNPFSDATPEFFVAFGKLLTSALGREITISAPYRGLRKEDLIREHGQLPLELTLTCIAPTADRHCGRCTKCYERQEAFRLAGVADRTAYAAWK